MSKNITNVCLLTTDYVLKKYAYYLLLNKNKGKKAMMNDIIQHFYTNQNEYESITINNFCSNFWRNDAYYFPTRQAKDVTGKINNFDRNFSRNVYYNPPSTKAKKNVQWWVISAEISPEFLLTINCNSGGLPWIQTIAAQWGTRDSC